MRILMASSEAVPYAKTGGLADVATGLSKALSDTGHDVTLVLPLYRRIIPESRRGEPVAIVGVELHNSTIRATIRRTILPGTNVEVLLVDQPTFFDRKQLYTEGGSDYPDNAERFIFFSRAVVEISQTLVRPHIIHTNDWQTALIPAIIRHERRTEGKFTNTGTILTIHNMAFHGQFPAWQMELTGIPNADSNWQEMEFNNHLNLLKTGIVTTDIITTVSPTYAAEICRPEFGCGMDQLLRERQETLVGILNGVDTKEWNPEIDTNLAAQFSAETFLVGKPKCKAALQAEMKLDVRPNAMLFGMVSRLTDQKGLDLIAQKADELLQADVQIAVLGTGDKGFENYLLSLQQRYPGKVAVKIGFNEGLAHRIEAGSDAYLMPSRFEPCGLNQQYSLIYGTIPIVHSVGGLADSVIDATPEHVDQKIANGFKFYNYDSEAYIQAVWRAVGTYTHYRDQWNQLVKNGMSRDLSWNQSANEYIKAYQRAIEIAGRSTN
ncbi:glycogen synthase GlgA [Planctomicrobium sp. SH668]|uniref:glycogen synthase GlgA n=1 Tax=Planctomicrobium sp. SH668 TaxID=3448126 RepID=UPI003F5C7D3F